MPLTIAAAILACLFFSGCQRQLTEEQKKEVASLKQTLITIQTDLGDAEAKFKQYAGGLIGALAAIRLETLKINKALFEQRIAAIESGAEIKQVIHSSKPDPIGAEKLGIEVADMEKVIAAERLSAGGYGGLVGAMKEVSVATKESTLAQLKHQYLVAKYGLSLPTGCDKATPVSQATPSTAPPAKSPQNKPAMVIGDGPFGLAMGMKPELFGDGLRELSPGIYEASDVPQSNQMFSSYIFRIGAQSGLCWVKALTPSISVNSFGSELRNKVDEVAEMLTDRYGQGKKQDFLYSGSIWRDPNDWTMGLLKNERAYGKSWEGKPSLRGDVKLVYVSASASSASSGRVAVEYAFTNEEQCEKEIKKAGAKGL